MNTPNISKAPPRPRYLSASILFLLALGAFGGPTVHADVIAWTGATNTFSSAGNWSGTHMPPQPGDQLVFGAAGAGGLLLNNDLTNIGGFQVGIAFSAGAPAYVIGDGTATANAGNGFVLSANITNNSTNLQTINNPFSLTTVQTFTTTAGGGDITLTAPIFANAGGIIAAGGGTLTISGSTGYSNGTTTTVSQGTLALNSNTAAGGYFSAAIMVGDGSTGSSNVALNFASGISGTDLTLQGGVNVRRVNPVTVASTGSAGTATIGFTGSTEAIYTDLTINRAVVLTSNSSTRLQRSYSGQITGPGAGAGNDSVIIDSGAGNWLDITPKDTGSASLANTFAGNLRVKSGNLEVSGLTYLSDTAANQNLTIPATASVTVDSGAALQVVWGDQTFDALNGGGTVQRNTADGQGTRTLTLGASDGSGSFSGAITSLFNLTKTGGGTQVLSGANTYTGVTTVNDGTLQSANNGALSTTPSIAVNNSSRLAVNYGGPADYTPAQVATLLAKTNFGSTAATFGFDTTNATDPVTYGNALTMPAGLAKLGTGTLTLTAANTYTGNTTINAGTLSLAGSLKDTTISIYGSGILSETSAGGISGGASIFLYGNGTSILAGTNPYTGQTFIGNGTLSLTGTLTGAGGVIISGAGILSETSTGAIGGGASIRVSPVGTSILAGTNTYTGATTIDSGTLQLGDGGTTGSLSPSSAITNNGTLAFNRSSNITQGTDFASVISGTGQVVQQGYTSLILTGANTYSGGTTIASGSIQIGNGGASGSIVGDVNGNGQLIFARSDDFTFGGVVSGGVSLYLFSGILRFTSPQTYTGTTYISTGSYLVLPTTTGNGLSASAVVYNLGGTLDISSQAQTFEGLLGLGTLYSAGGTTGSLTVQVLTGHTYDFSGTVGGSYPNFAFTKSGPGTQTLTGTNTYTGATGVTGGTLEAGISGKITASSGFSVSGGGTLLISNPVNNPLAAAPLSLDLGTLKFNDALGGISQTFTTLTLDHTATIDFGTGATGNTFEFAAFTLAPTFTGLTVLNWTPGNADHLVFDTGTFSGADLAKISFYGDAGQFLGTGTQVPFNGVTEIVPEPSAAALLAFGALALGSFRRRRR